MDDEPKKRTPRQPVKLVNPKYVVMTPEEREEAVRAVGALLAFVRKEGPGHDSDESPHGDTKT